MLPIFILKPKYDTAWFCNMGSLCSPCYNLYSNSLPLAYHSPPKIESPILLLIRQWMMQMVRWRSEKP